MAKKTKRMTAAEFIAELQSKPNWSEWVALQDEAEFRRQEAELALAEAPLVDDLRTAGFRVRSVWDLVNTSTSYPSAIPVLLAHLERPYPPEIRDGIARALAVPEAKSSGWDILIRAYRAEQHSRSKGGLAAAIAADAADDVIGEVIELVRDPRHGSSRVILLRALARSKDPRAMAALVELQTDPLLSKEISVILRRLNRRRRR